MKLCKDCFYLTRVKRNWPSKGSNSCCDCPSNKTIVVVTDSVDGQHERTNVIWRNCEEARQKRRWFGRDRCGPEAKWFILQETAKAMREKKEN